MRLITFLLCCLLAACSTSEPDTKTPPEEKEVVKELTFESRQIIDSARFWWAIAVGEINGDGLADLAFINNNGYGGYLGYYSGQKEAGHWSLHKIAEAPPTGGTFAAGDLEIGDMDGDGDTDVLAVKHTGEWDNAGESAELFWYENPDWQVHPIGTAPDAVKDLSLADFNADGRMDLAVLTFDEQNLSIHYQQADGSFDLLQNITYDNLHEGMDVGDMDGDGDIDIVANGYIFSNPGGDGKAEWPVESIDAKWHNQEGDWSANGTKAFLANVVGDEGLEVFISHSERGGYPLSYYQRTPEGWQEVVLKDSLPACHTLQVFDMDKDGDLDVVAGINKGRAVNINVDHFEVSVFLNEGDGMQWAEKVIENGGIYNGRVIDFEGDGDYDLFRLPDHEAKQLFLMENKTL